MGFAGLTVPTTVLSPTLPQQLNMHFLKFNNTLSPRPLYFIFIGVPFSRASDMGSYKPHFNAADHIIATSCR